MADKNIIKIAQKQLPDPNIYDKNYIDIYVPQKHGMYEVVTFAKQYKDGVAYWLALPYAR